MEIIVNSFDDLPKVAAQVVSKFSFRIIAFYGEMGVGKTTFIKSLCSHLGVDPEIVCSPTYSIVNEYQAHNYRIIYHFDFFRISHEYEVFDIGYEEYFYSNHYCFIEWPEKIHKLLPKKLLKIHIKTDGNIRIFTIDEINKKNG